MNQTCRITLGLSVGRVGCLVTSVNKMSGDQRIPEMRITRNVQPNQVLMEFFSLVEEIKRASHNLTSLFEISFDRSIGNN
jgi:hypothetical protein